MEMNSRSFEGVTTADEAKSRGAAAWSADDVDGAIHWFSKAIELDKDNFSGQLHVHYSNRSAAYLKKNNPDKALEDAEKCVELNPTWGKGYSRLGTALFRLGRLALASDAYTKGLKQDPENLELRKNLLETQRQRVAAQSTARRAARPREAISEYFKTHPLQTFQFALRSFLLINWLMYMLPLAATASLSAYRRVLYAVLLSNALSLYGRHGRVRFTTDYATKAVMDSASQTIMTTLLFVSNRPYLFGIVPLVLPEMTDFLWFLSGLLDLGPWALFEKLNNVINKFAGGIYGIPDWRRRGMVERWSFAKRKAYEWSAWVEVTFGVVLIVELILPRRNLILLFLYWQLIRMKYILNTTSGKGYIKGAFRTIDARLKILLTSRRCPRIVGVMYEKMKGFLATIVVPPKPPSTEASSSGSSCSVM